ncbi:Cof-type HAD-IIB family hydrolase [Beduini massiliensis]|uniref:Cof-type HAD-IIB family hydrolase n=1 Tax=Beduini massiliensis TaxID=1585974 RepID=UPI00059A9AAF|nr:Cof-type HAD-IIB family hydrolase [Beduini massiliensis]
MDKKIAFFDIDGTMVNVPNGMLHPSSETMRVLNTFKQQGNYIVVATARGSAPGSVQDIDFDGYIFNDGHYILFNKEVWLDDLFSKEDIAKQIAAYKKHGGKSMFCGHEQTWCEYLDDPMVIDHREMFSGTRTRPTDQIETFTAADVKAISCCVLFETVEQLKACYNELKEEFTMVPYYTGLIRMDVYRKGFTKGPACQFMFEKLGIPRENTYAFGDGINDKEMLQLVGHGIAMGNGLDEIKAVADDITDTVDQDGIAKAFKKYFNI